MNRSLFLTLGAGLAALSLAPAAGAQTRHRPGGDASPVSYRPLDVGGRHRYGPIIYRKDEIIAPGGFSAHGYGPGRLNGDEARRAEENADVRARTGGVYGYGFDGLGGTQLFGDRGESGYNNPFWGNSFSSNVGYNGVPTALAFGPGFANRYIADHEPDFDRDEPLPSPGDLGYRAGDEE